MVVKIIPYSLKQRFDQGSCFQDSSITPGPGKY